MADPVSSLSARVARLEVDVSALIDQREIDKAVRQALRERGPSLPIGWMGKAIAGIVAISALGSLILQLVRG
jgi:hypothetical protein